MPEAGAGVEVGRRRSEGRGVTRWREPYTCQAHMLNWGKRKYGEEEDWYLHSGVQDTIVEGIRNRKTPVEMGGREGGKEEPAGEESKGGRGVL